MSHFYPRSPCGERLVVALRLRQVVGISIHALLAESDQLGAVISTLVAGFLSTLSLRRATQQQQQRAGVYGISIHALLAESDVRRATGTAGSLAISIHALLAESDGIQPQRAVLVAPFLSTLSLRRATISSRSASCSCVISIHALLAESDAEPGHRDAVRHRISIHALLAESDPPQSAEIFLAMEISIHALLAESDRPAPRGRRGHADFYPRSPCGERPPTLQTDAPRLIISIHALLAESD